MLFEVHDAKSGHHFIKQYRECVKGKRIPRFECFNNYAISDQWFSFSAGALTMPPNYAFFILLTRRARTFSVNAYISRKANIETTPS